MTTVEKAKQQQRHTKWPQKEAKRASGMKNYELSGKTVSKRDTRWPQRETKLSKTSTEKFRSKTSEQGSIVSQLVRLQMAAMYWHELILEYVMLSFITMKNNITIIHVYSLQRTIIVPHLQMSPPPISKVYKAPLEMRSSTLSRRGNWSNEKGARCYFALRIHQRTVHKDA